MTKSSVVQVRVSEQQKTLWVEAAAKLGVPLSTWLAEAAAWRLANEGRSQRAEPRPARPSPVKPHPKGLRPAKLCRHGYQDCRVCRTGRYAA